MPHADGEHTHGGAKITITAGGVGALLATGWVLTHAKQVSRIVADVTLWAEWAGGVIAGSAILLIAVGVWWRFRYTSERRYAAKICPPDRIQAALSADPGAVRPRVIAGHASQPAAISAPSVNLNFGAGVSPETAAAAVQALKAVPLPPGPAPVTQPLPPVRDK